MEKEREENFANRIDEFLNFLDRNLVSKFPEPLRTSIRSKINELREIIMETREPRFAIVGRRGAGKSSLINAIFGSKVADVGHVKAMTGIGKWYLYEDKKGRMSILDTRGLGEGSKPDEKAQEKSSEEEVKASIDKECPDALLFLCKAKEIDARIDADIKSLAEIKSYIQKKHKYDPPIVGIITQVDELDPPDTVKPPYENSEKQKHIALATALLSQKMKTNFGDIVKVIPTSAYIRFENGKIARDRRWNIDKLVEYLIEIIPRSAQIELARIGRIKSVQKKMARIIIGSAATIAGGIGAEPIPVADLPFITGIQIGMIIGIGYISGKKMNKKTAVEFMSAMGLNVGAAFAFRQLAQSLIKLIPVAGPFISGAIAFAATWAIGEAAIAFFIDKKSAKEAKKTYKKEQEKKQRE